jgi:hypothetical protein
VGSAAVSRESQDATLIATALAVLARSSPTASGQRDSTWFSSVVADAGTPYLSDAATDAVLTHVDAFESFSQSEFLRSMHESVVAMATHAGLGDIVASHLPWDVYVVAPTPSPMFFNARVFFNARARERATRVINSCCV